MIAGQQEVVGGGATFTANIYLLLEPPAFLPRFLHCKTGGYMPRNLSRLLRSCLHSAVCTALLATGWTITLNHTSVSAATLDATTGVGSCTDAEVGWGPDNATAFTCVEQENYTVSVQYVNAQGVTVTGNFPVIRRSNCGVKIARNAGNTGYSFNGLGPRLWIPDNNMNVGDQFVLPQAATGRLTVGRVLSRTFVSKSTNVLAYNPLRGYKQVL